MSTGTRNLFAGTDRQAADEAPGIAQETPLDRAIREAQREAEKLTPRERRDRDWAALCLGIWSH